MLIRQLLGFYSISECMAFKGSLAPPLVHTDTKAYHQQFKVLCSESAKHLLAMSRSNKNSKGTERDE